MSKLSRRSFVTGLIAAPALHLGSAKAADVDVVIVGAGAAGIAAAARLTEAKRSFRLLEAGDRIGGRCVTDTVSFGVPFDRGAHWIRNPDTNPLVQRTLGGLDIYNAPRGLSMRVGPRDARDSELESLLAGLVRTRRALDEARSLKTDVPAARLLPRDLGAASDTIAFVTGPLACGKDLGDVSAIDLARMPERAGDAFCREGYGALLARIGQSLRPTVSTPVELVYWGGNAAVIDTPKGNIRPRAVILTVSTGVLADDSLEFIPPFPKRHADAAAKLALGSYDHIALELPGNPLGLLKDDWVFEQAQGARTAALLANVSGTSLHLVEIAGAFARDLSAQGEAAMIDFAKQWLVSLYGAGVRDKIRRAKATRWNAEPLVRGAMSAAAPGATAARKTLMEPIGGRVYLAGEALHETRWGTVEGAWESGERAADAVIRRLGGSKDDDDKPAKKPTKKPRRKR